jgi:hypothetical protein
MPYGMLRRVVRAIALMIDAVSTSKMSVAFYYTTRCSIPEDSHRKTCISIWASCKVMLDQCNENEILVTYFVLDFNTKFNRNQSSSSGDKTCELLNRWT